MRCKKWLMPLAIAGVLVGSSFIAGCADKYEKDFPEIAKKLTKEEWNEFKKGCELMKIVMSEDEWKAFVELTNAAYKISPADFMEGFRQGLKEED